MLLEGVRLMAVGMFTVFAFLTLLVGVMKASAAFFAANAHRFPEAEPASARSSRSGATGAAGNEDEIAVAIAVATAMRQGHKI